MNTGLVGNQTVLLKPEVSDMTQKLREEVEALKERKFGLKRQYVMAEQRALQKAQLKEIDSELAYKTKLLTASRLYEPYTPQNTWFAGWIKKPPVFSDWSMWISLPLLSLSLLSFCFAIRTNSDMLGVVALIALMLGLPVFLSNGFGISGWYAEKINSPATYKNVSYDWVCRIFRQILPADVASRYREAERQGLFDEILVFAPDENMFKNTIVAKVDPILVGRIRRKGTKEDHYFLITAWNLNEDFDHLGVS